MMYHAESFATNEFLTYIVGYGGELDTYPFLLSLPRVKILYLAEPPSLLRKLPFILGGPLKVLRQVIDILYILLVRIPPPEYILVQNPPSIPTLALVWLVARVRGSKVIIDWHNLGYSILALKLGDEHPLVKIAKWFESYFGRSAYAHLFVTNAMREYLVREWDLQGHKVVLHDRPPTRFHRATSTETHELFQRLLPSLSGASAPSLATFLPKSDPPFSTPFTHISTYWDPVAMDVGAFTDHTKAPRPRPDRPALVVSSTSWTPDEDFGMLLAALAAYEHRARELETASEDERLPKVLAAVTGKGPLRAQHMADIDRLQTGADGGEAGPWRFVRCISLWLEADDYPLLLGSADLGVSLHASSSALDLPMKVVDMFGCGLPVCALGFACLGELVRDGVNGLVFDDAAQLASQLETLLRGFPHPPALEALRDAFGARAGPGATGGRAHRWEWGTWTENWDQTMRPLLLHDVSASDGADER
ncbi:beta-1,4-mannosyltransferase [Epithele typhae]|uniref:beta-1,4-mannosyltransferase n=1 Tax=Epithele typhae TaxID=378194 RepID=UPI002007F14F|nr:beta-1,4-mannosyltransferase [Epithele typhae]KAH9917359.1 beta-1,4-mannosyltransferase [Epithele typhae]